MAFHHQPCENTLILRFLLQTLGPGIRAQVLGFEEEDEDDDDEEEEEEEEGLFKANAVG